MLDDQSVIEWASGWLPDDDQRQRFLDALREELKSRADEQAKIRAALVTALEDVKRGNDDVEKLLAELKAERAAWSELKAYVNSRATQPSAERTCTAILDEMERLERP